MWLSMRARVSCDSPVKCRRVQSKIVTHLHACALLVDLGLCPRDALLGIADMCLALTHARLTLLQGWNVALNQLENAR